MPPDSRINVELRLGDARLRDRVAACLAQRDVVVTVVQRPTAPGADVVCDVVVADDLARFDVAADGPVVGRVFIAADRATVASDAAVDAVLPAEFLDRELVLACRLVAESARLRRQLAHEDAARRVWHAQALADPVTGLANRRGWTERSRAALAECRRRGAPLTVAVVDLDHFKSINDTLGHTAGDGVLRRAGARLAHALRKDDTVARLGGDEFGLILPDLGVADAEGVVDRIRRRVDDVDLSEIASGERTPGVPTLAGPAVPSSAAAQKLTASAGYVTIAPGDLPATTDETITETILDAADRAMYRAKQEGRNCTRGGEGFGDRRGT